MILKHISANKMQVHNVIHKKKRFKAIRLLDGIEPFFVTGRFTKLTSTGSLRISV